MRKLFGNDDPYPAGATIADLPDDFVDRVEHLTSQTILWPPKQYRYAMCVWTADHIEAMNQGDSIAATLQKAMSNLLLAHVPKRCSTSHELSTRFKLWRNGQYSILLCRIKEQTRVAPLAVACDATKHAKRARRMARCGAYRKGVQSLRGRAAQFS